MALIDKARSKKKLKDPMSSETWRHAALVAVLAWAGVGADSLSSANYGPEEAYKALHLSGHEPLVLWLAVITALTVVVISLAYVQIIRLFPNGGGGFFGNTAAGGASSRLPRPSIAANDTAYYRLCLVVAALMFLLAVWHVRGKPGRAWAAIRQSQATAVAAAVSFTSAGAASRRCSRLSSTRRRRRSRR